MIYDEMSRDELIVHIEKQRESQQSLNDRFTKANGKLIRIEREFDKTLAKNGQLSARNCQLVQRVAKLEQQQSCGSDYVVHNTATSKELERLQKLCAKLYKIFDGMGIKVDNKGNVVPKDSIWDTDKLLATVHKDVDEEIKFRLVGNDYGFFVDIRVFKYDKPTRKGLCLRPNKIQDVANALDRVMDML